MICLEVWTNKGGNTMTDKLSCYVVADPAKCTGCKACELACFAEHNRKNNSTKWTVGTVKTPVTPRLFVTRTVSLTMPVQCRHCEDAPCLNACQKHAISRKDGEVIIDDTKCIGCKDCIMACPFGAIAMLPLAENDVLKTQPNKELFKWATKCDLCEGIEGGPACVRVCPNEALQKVDAAAMNIEKQVKAAEGLYATRI